MQFILAELIQQFQSDPLIEKIFHDPQVGA